MQIQKTEDWIDFGWDIRAKEMIPLARMWLEGLAMDYKSICFKLLLREVEHLPKETQRVKKARLALIKPHSSGS